MTHNPDSGSDHDPRRRSFVLNAGALAAGTLLVGTNIMATPAPVTKASAPAGASTITHQKEDAMSYITTKDGTDIYYKDWGTGQPIVFHHGWPLSSDDWDAQMMFFLLHGYRVVAHDRRGHGRSTQTSKGNDMDTYVADAAAVVEHLGLKNAIHIGHSTGGGEVARYVAKHGKAHGVAKAVLVSAVPPLMLKTAGNPGGLDISVFDGFRKGLAENRAQFYREVPIPFYGFNRTGAKTLDGVVDNWWRQGMMGGAVNHYEGIKAFSETDFTEDLKQISVPTLIMHGDDDQIVPIADASLLSAKLVPGAELKVYKGYPHGMLTVHADVLNADLLAFVKK